MTDTEPPKDDGILTTEWTDTIQEELRRGIMRETLI